MKQQSNNSELQIRGTCFVFAERRQKPLPFYWMRQLSKKPHAFIKYHPLYLQAHTYSCVLFNLARQWSHVVKSCIKKKCLMHWVSRLCCKLNHLDRNWLSQVLAGVINRFLFPLFLQMSFICEAINPGKMRHNCWFIILSRHLRASRPVILFVYWSLTKKSLFKCHKQKEDTTNKAAALHPSDCNSLILNVTVKLCLQH